VIIGGLRRSVSCAVMNAMAGHNDWRESIVSRLSVCMTWGRPRTHTHTHTLTRHSSLEPANCTCNNEWQTSVKHRQIQQSVDWHCDRIASLSSQPASLCRSAVTPCSQGSYYLHWRPSYPARHHLSAVVLCYLYPPIIAWFT